MWLEALSQRISKHEIHTEHEQISVYIYCYIDYMWVEGFNPKVLAAPRLEHLQSTASFGAGPFGRAGTCRRGAARHSF